MPAQFTNLFATLKEKLVKKLINLHLLLIRLKLYKIVFALILTFGLSEGLLRVVPSFNPRIKSFLYSSRYDLNFSRIKTLADLVNYAPCPMKPLTNINGFVINSKGFYTPDYNEQKAADVFRIGFIGDSFVIGVVPYSKNIVSLFQETAQVLTKNKKIEVINWGMPCLGPQYEEKIMEVEGFKNNPDYVIWMFFVGNDFSDEMYPGEKLPVANVLTKNIYTLRLIRNLQKSFQGVKLNTEVPLGNSKTYSQGGVYVGLETPYNDEQPTFNQALYLKIQAEKLNLFSPATFPEKSWESIQKTLLNFKRNCEERKIKCLVVLEPDEIQVNDELLNEVIKFSGVRRESLTIDYPQQQTIQFFKERGFQFLDLLPAFQRAGKGQKLYHPADTHWNIAGNKLAAEEIWNFARTSMISP